MHHLNELEQYIKDLEDKNGKGKGGVISVGQWEIHPWLERPAITKWCVDRGVVVQASTKRCEEPLLIVSLIRKCSTGVLSSSPGTEVRGASLETFGEETSEESGSDSPAVEHSEGGCHILLSVVALLA